MPELDVRIVTLEPLHVAAALGYGGSPEMLACQKLAAWARLHGLLEQPGHRFFGFNNPSPSHGSPNYGYEQWITVGSEAHSEGDIQVKDFPGGLYAVATCTGGGESIPEVWQQLVIWLEHSPYRQGAHQWLEECLTPELLFSDTFQADERGFRFDLYLPIHA